MNGKTRPTFLELAWLSLIALTLIGPGAMTLLAHCFPALFQSAPWLRNSSLVGVVVKKEEAAASCWNILHAKYQESVAASFNEDFTGRELCIRLANEAWFRVFRANGLTSQSSVIVGRNGALIEKLYLVEYAFQRPAEHDLLPLVKAIATVQVECQRRGVAFVVLITPSKASILPGAIPKAWRRRNDPRPRGYSQFVRLLQEHHVAHVDGHAILAAVKAEAPAPIFPLGGIHWSEYGCWLTTRALLSEFQKQGKPVKQIDDPSIVVSRNPVDTDADLLALLNLAFKWHYPVAQVRPRALNLKENDRLSLAIVGGSFMWQTSRLLSASEQFSEIDVYYYYKVAKTFFRHNLPFQISAPVPSVDLSREILSSDCVILEINESEIPTARPVKAFVSEAASFFQQNTVSLPLAYDGYQAASFNRKISFCSGQPDQIKPNALIGFNSAEPAGTLMSGRSATIHLTLPPSSKDLILNLEAKGQIDTGGVAPSSVSIYVNDEPGAEWDLASSPEKCEFRIAADMVRKHRLVLRFEISKAAEPVNRNEGDGLAGLGLSLSQLQLRETSD